MRVALRKAIILSRCYYVVLAFLVHLRVFVLACEASSSPWSGARLLHTSFSLVADRSREDCDGALLAEECRKDSRVQHFSKKLCDFPDRCSAQKERGVGKHLGVCWFAYFSPFFCRFSFLIQSQFYSTSNVRLHHHRTTLEVDCVYISGSWWRLLVFSNIRFLLSFFSFFLRFLLSLSDWPKY